MHIYERILGIAAATGSIKYHLSTFDITTPPQSLGMTCRVYGANHPQLSGHELETVLCHGAFEAEGGTLEPPPERFEIEGGVVMQNKGEVLLEPEGEIPFRSEGEMLRPRKVSSDPQIGTRSDP